MGTSCRQLTRSKGLCYDLPAYIVAQKQLGGDLHVFAVEQWLRELRVIDRLRASGRVVESTDKRRQQKKVTVGQTQGHFCTNHGAIARRSSVFLPRRQRTHQGRADFGSYGGGRCPLQVVAVTDITRVDDASTDIHHGGHNVCAPPGITN